MQDSFFHSSDGRIYWGNHEFIPALWAWRPCAGAPADAAPASASEALAALARIAPVHNLVVGVIGPRDATPEQMQTAESVGRLLGTLGVTVICGGKSGVMEATCKGCSEAGGRPIGILPDSTPNEANPYVAIPLPTGLREARNIVIVRASRVLIAVGDSPGTLTEVAYGLHFGRPVIGVAGAARLDGVDQTKDAEAAVDLALARLLMSLPVTEAI